MRETTRKAKVTPETKAESESLKKIWLKAKDRPSQAQFGETFGIGSQSAVTSFLNGTTPLSLKAARGFARGLGCHISDFSERLSATVDDAREVNQSRPISRQWPFLTVTPDQYWNELTQAHRDILEATANSFVAAGVRESPSKQAAPASTNKTIKAA